ncbi:MAG: hypothetical protein HYV42_00975 [Candidatus Magasanikbacteria bacterium]|nr:hypothetical protein [Candidatus Magasanikbacteria bacterium]
MEWGNLLSGFFGSIIGAGVTYFATIKSIRETAELDVQRRLEHERDLVKQILNYLKEELDFNLSLSDNIMVNGAKIRFLDKAYEMAKLNAGILPGDMIKTLNPIYREIIRYNSLVDFDQAALSYGDGRLDEAIFKQGTQVKLGIQKVLETYILGPLIK